MKASVGICPMSRLGATIGDALGYDGFNFNEERVSMFHLLVSDRLKQLMSDKCECDDIRIFVKPEPHVIRKIKEGRFRLISAVSMVDSMIDRMLFGNLADKVLESVGRTPVRIGWTPILGGYRELRDLLPGRVVCIDKTSWDWTVPFWMIKLWLNIVLGLSNDHPSFWERAVRMRFKALFQAPIFQFDDGTRVRQDVPGIMKSGCFLTIILNSVGQLLLHYMINQKMGLPLEENEPQCMGDDTVQRMFERLEEYIKHIGDLGFKVKEAKVQDWIEFAGFVIDDKTWPSYWEKHLFLMTHSTVQQLENLLPAYQMLYSQEPAMSSYIKDAMLKVCPKKIIPRSILTSFVSGLKNGVRGWFRCQDS